ncbi:MAG: cytochrome c [Ginsengibacter sp.]
MPDTTEAFWIIKNGIKMTSMPAFGPTHSDQKIWAITDFLLNKMNKMSPGISGMDKEVFRTGC